MLLLFITSKILPWQIRSNFSESIYPLSMMMLLFSNKYFLKRLYRYCESETQLLSWSSKMLVRFLNLWIEKLSPCLRYWFAILRRALSKRSVNTTIPLVFSLSRYSSSSSSVWISFWIFLFVPFKHWRSSLYLRRLDLRLCSCVKWLEDLSSFSGRCLLMVWRVYDRLCRDF